MAPPKKERVCHVCQREFSKHDHLLRHLRIHNNERPYACDLCDKTFARQDVMQRHRKSHDGPTPTKRKRLAQEDDGDDDEDEEDLPTAQPTAPTPLDQLANAVDYHIAESDYTDHHFPFPMAAPPLPAPAEPMFTMPAPAPFPSTASFPSPAQGHALPLTQQDPMVGSSSEDFFSSLPAVLDAQFWADMDVEWLADPLDKFAASRPASPPRPAPSRAAQRDEPPADPLDLISRKWPKLGRVALSSDTARQLGDSRSWTFPYQALRAEIDLKPLEPPTHAFLMSAIRHYFSVFHNDQPFLHVASFNPEAHNPLLVLAICATGARFMSSSEAAVFTQQVFGRLGLLLQRYWSDDNNDRDQLDLIRVALLIQIHHLASGQDRLVASACALQGSVVAHARRLGLFSPDGPCRFVPLDPILLHSSRPEDLQAAWLGWVRAEEARRVVNSMFLYEAFLYAQLRDHMPPNLALGSVHVTISSDNDESFAARDAASWARIITTRPPPVTSTMLDLVRYLYDRRDHATFDAVGPSYSISALMLQLGGLYQHIRCRTLAILPDADGTRPSDPASHLAIDRWRRTFMPRAIPPTTDDMRWRYAEMKMTWNSHCISSLLSVDALEVGNGRDGAAAAIGAKRLLDRYRNTPILRRALLHTGQILDALGTPMRIGYPGLIFASVCFKAALWLATYAEPIHPMTAGQYRSPYDLSGDLDWDLVGAAGIEGHAHVPRYPDDLHLSPAARFVYFGGPWTWRGLTSPQAILRWTADRQTEVACGDVMQYGNVLSGLLRMRADTM